eukprot:962210-Rhodomonas_salina.1
MARDAEPPAPPCMPPAGHVRTACTVHTLHTAHAAHRLHTGVQRCTPVYSAAHCCTRCLALACSPSLILSLPTLRLSPSLFLSLSPPPSLPPSDPHWLWPHTGG